MRSMSYVNNTYLSQLNLKEMPLLARGIIFLAELVRN